MSGGSVLAKKPRISPKPSNEEIILTLLYQQALKESKISEKDLWKISLQKTDNYFLSFEKFLGKINK